MGVVKVKLNDGGSASAVAVLLDTRWDNTRQTPGRETDMGAANGRRCMFDEWRATAVGDANEQSVSVPGRPAAFADADGVTYVSTFADPRGHREDVAVVELRGLYARATVDVTGQRLDGDGAVEHDTYFEPLRIPVLPYEDNELSVTCYAPDDRFGGLHDTDTVPDSEAVPGIWWGASLEAHPLPYIDRLRVRPELTDEGARLHVQTTVVSEDPIDERITYSLKPTGDVRTRGTMNRGRVETDGPGKTTVSHTIDVHDPALWWPRDLGRQHRYRLRATLGDHERTVTTGICDVSRDGDQFLVNGQQFSVRGVNLVTSDTADVDRACDLNANLVRARAHALPPAVYEACDEAGLLVWQDLPLTGPGEFDVDRARTLASSLVTTYSTHPSLAVFGVHDEPTDRFADGLGRGFLDRLRLRWRAWRTSYDRGPAEAVADAFPDYRPVVPVVGGPGVAHDAAAYYPGWDYGAAEDIEGLLARYPTDLLAAFGAGSLGEAVDAAAGFDADKHANRVDGGVEPSQTHQRAVLRTVAEVSRSRNLDAVASALRDTDGAGMGVYAADGSLKLAQEALATAYQPIQVFLTKRSGDSAEITVVNDGPSPVSGTVRWDAGGDGGLTDVTVDAGDRWVGTVSLPTEADAVTLALETDSGVAENHYEF